jgi:hypothetical protein
MITQFIKLNIHIITLLKNQYRPLKKRKSTSIYMQYILIEARVKGFDGPVAVVYMESRNYV